MTDSRNISSGAMEQGGAYNKHGRLPAGGGALALPHLEKAALNFTPKFGCSADRDRGL
jgi:hypothetical protein